MIRSKMKQIEKIKDSLRWMQITIVALIVVVFLIIFSNVGESKPDPLSLDWACMDGCSNMQELAFGKGIYKDDSMKQLHHTCTEICHKTYLEESVP